MSGTYVSKEHIERLVCEEYWGNPQSVVGAAMLRVAERVSDLYESKLNDRDWEIVHLKEEINRLRGIPNPTDGIPMAQ